MKKAIVDYQIVAYNSTREAQRRIKILIDQAWQPFGGGFSSGEGSNISYCQAMVRYAYQPEIRSPSPEVAYVSAEHLDELAEKVGNRLHEGWSLQGTLVIANGGQRFFQAMLRTTRSPEKQPDKDHGESE